MIDDIKKYKKKLSSLDLKDEKEHEQFRLEYLSKKGIVQTLFFKLKEVPNDQKKIDEILLKLDGTENKKKLGANSILAVSMAVKKLSARVKKLPLFKTFLVKNNFKLPYPLMNIINGGAHANNGLRIQEFMIRQDRAKSFTDAMRICFLVILSLIHI